MRCWAMRRAMARLIPFSRVPGSSESGGILSLRENVDRAGDLMKLELTEPDGPCPMENVDRVGD